MKSELNLVTPLHTRTQRDYLARMQDDKIHCMARAKEYGTDYWDGKRRYGYGGYRYDGRWQEVAGRLIDYYQLQGNVKILDVGCGKAHLLYELSQLLPEADCIGFDISEPGIADAPAGIREHLHLREAQTIYPWPDDHFDLVLSLGCLHNLKVFDLQTAIKEIERVGKQKYIMVESYRNNTELFNLQCWALTCESFFAKDEWQWLYQDWHYTGDYEFIYFE